jgi:rhomboid family GlyGly-CTERM serine protease
MLNLPLQAKYCTGPLIIILISIFLALIAPVSTELFTYDRQQLANLQWWRSITGHFLHTNTTHLLLNISGATLLWALHGHYYQVRHYLTLFFILCLGTSLGLYFFAPQMQWYVGLSGVLHGLFITGAYFDIRHKLKTGWIILISVWLKVLHEQVFGASEDVAQLIAANVAIDAHLFGVISGSLVVVCYWYVDKLNHPQKVNHS